MALKWHGMTVTGAVTRSVLDNALFLDAVKDSGPSFAEAAARRPDPLRIAYSLKMPRGTTGRLGDEQRGAVERTAERLRELGHTVVERDPDYGNAAASVVARYLDGISVEAAAMPHPERLARWTRGLAGMGARIPQFLVERALAQEAVDRDRVGALFADHDVLLTPALSRLPPPIGEWIGLPAPVMLNGMANFTAYLGFWNHTGQPAAAVPVELAPEGLPVAVQLVGRSGDEATLLSLSAQLESAFDWPARRPPLAA